MKKQRWKVETSLSSQGNIYHGQELDLSYFHHNSSCSVKDPYYDCNNPLSHFSSQNKKEISIFTIFPRISWTITNDLICQNSHPMLPHYKSLRTCIGQLLNEMNLQIEQTGVTWLTAFKSCDHLHAHSQHCHCTHTHAISLVVRSGNWILPHM